MSSNLLTIALSAMQLLTSTGAPSRLEQLKARLPQITQAQKNGAVFVGGVAASLSVKHIHSRYTSFEEIGNLLKTGDCAFGKANSWQRAAIVGTFAAVPLCWGYLGHNAWLYVKKKMNWSPEDPQKKGTQS